MKYSRQMTADQYQQEIGQKRGNAEARGEGEGEGWLSSYYEQTQHGVNGKIFWEEAFFFLVERN